MRVIMFQHRFADLVESRQKRQTIRALGKPHHPAPFAGQELSLRKWADKPYRSPQVRLGPNETCVSVHPVFIGIIRDRFEVRVDHEPVEDLDTFAKADGFTDAADFQQWFRNTHGLPFVGRLIKW
jgi:hypothetical protein